MNIQQREENFSLGIYASRGISLVRGKDAILWDDKGKEYIDCTSGIGVANIGHANPALASAIANQAKKLVTCPGIFFNDQRGLLMEKLVDLAPEGLNRVFLCNSGTESIEAAIKFARKTTKRNGIVSAMRGFHGRTMGALSATFKYRDSFEPLLADCKFVPFNKLEKLDADYMKALEAGDSSAQSACVTKKKALRDATSTSAIDAADNITKLKSAWDTSTLGTSPYA